jgi:hypothetical protein
LEKTANVNDSVRSGRSANRKNFADRVMRRTTHMIHALVTEILGQIGGDAG